MVRQIDVPVHLDPKTFRRYCAFDAFRRRRRWFAPLMIGMVLVTASLAGLLNLVPMGGGGAGVLMGLGIAVPLAAFGLYAIQVEAQIASQRLGDSPLVYALRMTPDCVRVSKEPDGGDAVDLGWDSLCAAFRRPGAIYLYATPERAFILPEGQASAPDEALWEYIRKYLGEGKCLDVR